MAARRGRPPKLYTLTEVSKRTGISMPTLQKYKQEHAEEIPSEGEGRRQRYPIEALKVFERLKAAALKRRGRRAEKKRSSRRAKKARRPRSRGQVKKARTKTARTKAAGGELLSLAEIERRTGISYPTLLRYTRLHIKKIPHQGRGRKRRYSPQAVEVFKELRSGSRRGRRKGSSSAAAARTPEPRLTESLRRLEKAQLALQKQVAALEKRLSRPIQVTLRR